MRYLTKPMFFKVHTGKKDKSFLGQVAP